MLLILTSILLGTAGCYDDSDDDSGGDKDALAGSTSTYSFTCPSGTQASVPVTNGPCKSQQQNYAYAFSCNQVNDFASTCSSYYSCAVNNSTGEYRSYYQQHLNYCSSYGNAIDDETVLVLIGKR